MRSIIRNLMYLSGFKRIHEDKLEWLHIKKSINEISVFHLSTNLLLSFSEGGRLYYFRECPRICGFSEYYCQSVNRFFVLVARSKLEKNNFSQKILVRIDFGENEILAFKEYLDKKQADSDFFKKISKTDIYSQKIGFSIWKDNVYDKAFFDYFGLEELPLQLYEIAVNFVWYMRAEASNYRMRFIARGNGHSYFSAVRAVSSRIVAEEFGLSSLITNAQWCELEIDNQTTLKGIMCDAAPGVRMADTSATANGTLQNELTTLNILDAIVFQPDHGPNNYNIHISHYNNCSVCAFDNDNPLTFLPSFSAKHHFSGCEPLIGHKKIFRRPFVDFEVAEKINNVDYRKLKQRLSPYLNRLQTFAVIVRIRKIKASINRTMKTNADFLLKPVQWCDNTVTKELNGEYGITYLKKAVSTRTLNR